MFCASTSNNSNTCDRRNGTSATMTSRRRHEGEPPGSRRRRPTDAGRRHLPPHEGAPPGSRRRRPTDAGRRHLPPHEGAPPGSRRHLPPHEGAPPGSRHHLPPATHPSLRPPYLHSYPTAYLKLKLNPCTNQSHSSIPSWFIIHMKRCNIRSCFLAVTHQRCCYLLNDPNDADAKQIRSGCISQSECFVSILCWSLMTR